MLENEILNLNCITNSWIPNFIVNKLIAFFDINQVDMKTVDKNQVFFL